MTNLDNILSDFNSQFQKAEKKEQLEQLRVEFLGKKGAVTMAFGAIKDIPAQNRKEFGAKINEIKNEISGKIEEKKEVIDNQELEEQLTKQKIDLSQPARPRKIGYAHPISKTIKEIREIFGAMGFDFADASEIENDFFNFSALNMPKNHPARQMQDTFYLKNYQKEASEAIDCQPNLLRTHTSNTQIRKMLDSQPPLKTVAIGRVFRRDSDQTHTPMFHQIEGFMVDETTKMANLKWLLEEFLAQFFETNKVNLRFRPSFFPFTEPSAEVDIGYSIENGRIKIGSDEKFMEILGCGMINPNVLKNCNIDSQKYQGFAFGIGIERLAMLKYGINDLRTFFENDQRFLSHYGFKAAEF